MKLLHYLLLTTLIVHTIPIHAMDEASPDVFDPLCDDAEEQSLPPFALEFSLPTTVPISPTPSDHDSTVQYAKDYKRRGPLDGSDSESEDNPTPLPWYIQCHIDAITKQIKKGTLRKFTYDMELMRDLDSKTVIRNGNTIDISAYAFTMAYLQQYRQECASFMYSLKMTGGTPDIIHGIEQKTLYRFPNNIVSTHDTLPNTTPLVLGSCCTEKRVREEKNAVIEGEIYGLPQGIQDKITQAIPTPAYFIQTAVNQYLDTIKQQQNEPPEVKRKRVYKKALAFLYTPEPKD